MAYHDYVRFERPEEYYTEPYDWKQFSFTDLYLNTVTVWLNTGRINDQRVAGRWDWLEDGWETDAKKCFGMILAVSMTDFANKQRNKEGG